GARSMDGVRGGHRPRRARHRAGDRASPVLAARRRHGHVGLHVAVKRAAPASAALVLATVALQCAMGARARAAEAPPAADAGAPDAAVDAPAPDAGTGGADGGGADARAVFEPPRALTETQVPYPTDAPPIDEPVSVTVKLRIDTTGAVTKTELVTPPAPPFDEAVM